MGLKNKNKNKEIIIVLENYRPRLKTQELGLYMYLPYLPYNFTSAVGTYALCMCLCPENNDTNNYLCIRRYVEQYKDVYETKMRVFDVLLFIVGCFY